MDDDQLMSVPEAVLRYTEVKMKIAEGLRKGFKEKELDKLEKDLEIIDRSFLERANQLREKLVKDNQSNEMTGALQ